MPAYVATWVASAVGGGSFVYGVVYAAAYVATIAAISYGVSALSEQPGVGGRQDPGQLLDIQVRSDSPRQIIVGERRSAGSLVGRYITGDNNDNLIEVIALADHRVDACLLYFADGIQQAENLTSGDRAGIIGYRSEPDRLFVTWHDGRWNQTADADLFGRVLENQPAWTSNHKGQGVSYAIVEMIWDDDVMLQPVTSQFQLRGGRWYDRREDSTAGGSGTQRHKDPDTWTYTNNPDVFADHYQLGVVPYPDADIYSWGIGLKPWQLPYDIFKEEADISDETVLMKDGTTYQDRYRLNAVFAGTQTHRDILTQCAQAKAGRVVDRGGRLSLIGPQARTSVMTLYDDDLIVGQQTKYSDKLSISSLYNTFRGTFPDPEQGYRPTEYPPLSDSDWIADDGGDELPEDVNIDVDTDEERVQRLIWLHAQDQRRQERLTESYGPQALEIEEGDWFTRVSARFPAGKLFEAIRCEYTISESKGFFCTILSKGVKPEDVAWNKDYAADLSRPPAPTDEAVFADMPAPTITATAVTLTGTGTSLPAIKVAWSNATDTRIRTALVEITPVASGGPIIQLTCEAGAGSRNEVSIDQGITPGTAYYVRVRYQGLVLPGPWSTTASVTAGATFVVPVAGTSGGATPGSGLATALATLTAADAALAAADAALTASIATTNSNLSTAVATLNAADSALNSSLTSAVSTLNAADAALNTAITSEAGVRASADSTLTANLATATANIATNASAIATETAARVSADSTLTANVATNTANIATNATAISTETATRASETTAINAKFNVRQNLMPYPSGLGNSAPATAVGWAVAGGDTSGGGLTQYSYAPLGGPIYIESWGSGYTASAGNYRVYYYDVPVNDAGNYVVSLAGLYSTFSAASLTLRLEAYNGASLVAQGVDTTFAAADRKAATVTAPVGTTKIRLLIVINPQTTATYSQIIFYAIKIEPGAVPTMYTADASTVTAQAGVITNASAIATETAARASADSTLTANVATNTANIATNSTAIATEAATRASADSTLTANVATNTANISTNATAIATEASTRASADSTLTANLATANANISTNASAIATETATRASETSTLSAKLSVNANLLPNSTGANGTTGWGFGAGPFIRHVHELWGPWFTRATTGVSGITSYESSDEFPISPNAAYIMSAVPWMAGRTAGTYRLYVAFYDSGHTFISEAGNIALTVDDTSQARRTAGTFTTPSGAAYARFVIGLVGFSGSGAYSQVGFWQAKVEKGTVATVWSDDATTQTIAASVTTNTAAIATETAARASADSTLTANLATANANISSNATAIATETATRASETSALSATFNTGRSNLVPNGDLSNGTAGWTLSGFTLNTSWVGPVLETTASTPQAFSPAFPVTAGQQFTMGANKTDTRSANPVYIVAYYYTSTDGTGSPFANSALSSTPNASGRVTVTATPPSGANSARLLFEAPGAGSGYVGIQSITAVWGARDIPNAPPTASLASSNAAITTNANAIATETSARASADSTLTANLATANANISTNAAAIATESATRATQDTLIRATMGNASAQLPAAFTNDGAFHTNDPSTLADLAGTFATVAGIGRVYQTTTPYYIVTNKGRLPVITGHTYRITAKVRVTVDQSNGYAVQPLLGFMMFNAATGNYANADFWQQSFVTRTTADGWVTMTGSVTAATILASYSSTTHVAALFEAAWNGSGGPNATTQTALVQIEDITDIAAANAAISTNASAIATETAARASADSSLTASIGTTNANVTTNASAIATINGAAAFWQTVVSASGGDLAAVRLRAGTGGSYLDLVSTVFRLLNVSNGAIIEVMRAIGGEAYFSRPISSDDATAGVRVTVGPNTGGQVILWFGSNTVAPASQTKANAYFALGMDQYTYVMGKVLKPSTPTAVTASSTANQITTSETTMATANLVDLQTGDKLKFTASVEGTSSGSITAFNMKIYRDGTLLTTRAGGLNAAGANYSSFIGNLPVDLFSTSSVPTSTITVTLTRTGGGSSVDSNSDVAVKLLVEVVR